jgi:hypothetical protein
VDQQEIARANICSLVQIYIQGVHMSVLNSNNMIQSALGVRRFGLSISILSLLLAFWIEPLSIMYLFVSISIGAVFTALTIAYWRYQAEPGSVIFWLFSLLIIGGGYVAARNLAMNDRSYDNNIWVIVQFYASVFTVFFGALCLFHKSVKKLL